MNDNYRPNLFIIIKLSQYVSTTTTILAEVAELVETLLEASCNKIIISFITNEIKRNMQKLSNIQRKWWNFRSLWIGVKKSEDTLCDKTKFWHYDFVA